MAPRVRRPPIHAKPPEGLWQADFAALLGIDERSLASERSRRNGDRTLGPYVHRPKVPLPDGYDVSSPVRRPWWLPETVRAYMASRIGKGGRPRGSTAVRSTLSPTRRDLLAKLVDGHWHPMDDLVPDKDWQPHRIAVAAINWCRKRGYVELDMSGHQPPVTQYRITEAGRAELAR